MRTLHSLIFVLCLVSLSGCATWTPGGTAYKHPAGYTLTVPAGWIFHPALAGELFATHDGVILQTFKITSLNLPYTLQASKTQLTSSLTLYEIAESCIAEGKADRTLTAFTVNSQTQVKIGAHPSIRYDYRHTTADGLQISARRWIVLRGDKLWMATYSAPSRHYYEQDLTSVTAAVENIVFDPPVVP